MLLSFQYHSTVKSLPAPSVLVSLAHDETNLYANFRVLEPTIRAVSKTDQDPVYEDSCVEIFITHEGIDGPLLVCIRFLTY